MILQSRNSGVTLIELMVVMAIMGIIAAIAIPAYNGYIAQGKKTACQKEVAALKLAEENFFNDAGNNAFFAGNGVAALQAASGGWYTPSSDVTGAVTPTNCSFVIAAGTTANIATSYTITVTGINDLAKEVQPIISYNGP